MLTSNTGEDSDWSVDRLDNDFGYNPNNIFIMSSEANKAKNSVSLQDLLLYIFNLDSEILSREPKLNLYDEEFWVKLYLAIFERMPSDMFCKAAHELFSNQMHEKTIRDQILMEMMASAVDTHGEPLSIKSFENEIKQSELLRAVTPNNLFTKAELIKIRKSALKVIGNLNATSFTNSERQNLQDAMCSGFMSIKRNSDYIATIERLVNQAREKPTTCGVILGVMSKRYSNYGI